MARWSAFLIGSASFHRETAFTAWTDEEIKRHHGYTGSTALFGATGAVAWMLKLMLRGFALLATHVDDRVQMFSAEAQARAFIARRRAQRQLEVGTRPSS